MNRKSIYCYPTIAAALVATAAMGWTASAQAQTIPQAESASEDAVAPEVSSTESVLQATAVLAAIPAELPQPEAIAAPAAVEIHQEAPVSELSKPLPASSAEFYAAEEPAQAPQLTPASTPIQAWSPEEVEVAPVLSRLAAGGAELNALEVDAELVVKTGDAIAAAEADEAVEVVEVVASSPEPISQDAVTQVQGAVATDSVIDQQVIVPPELVTSEPITSDPIALEQSTVLSDATVLSNTTDLSDTTVQDGDARPAITPFQPAAEVPAAVASFAQVDDAPAAITATTLPVSVNLAQAAEAETLPAPIDPSPRGEAGNEESVVEENLTEESVVEEPQVEDSEPRVLVAEVQVSGAEGNPQEAELVNAVYDSIQTRPGQPTTSTQLQDDLNAVFATGYFEDVNFRPEDTPLGVRVVFLVNPNPVLRQVAAPETQALPAEVIDEAFSDQYGQTLNFNNLQDGVQQVNSWYQDNGYVLAQVVDATQVSDDGTVNLVIAEGIVDSVAVRFLDADGNLPEDPNETIKGRTKDYIVTREFSLKPGDVFRRDQAEADLQRVFGLGIFEDVRLSLDPAPDDPRKVVVVANVIEARSGSIGASGGVSSASGLFGSFSVGQENFRGRNQKLRSEITLGQRDFLFDLSYTDPWIKGDPYRTSYTVNAFRRRSVSLIYSGGDRDVDLPNGDTPRILRLGGGLRFSRPLSKNVFEPAEWNASAGLQYQRISIRDSDGDRENEDEFGNDLTFSGDDSDDLVLLQLGAARDRRNNRLQPTQGSITRFNMDQSVPIGNGSILFNRVRVNHSQYFPVNFLRLTEGCRKSERTVADCPQTLAFNIQAGTILGDLPPYEAFSIGGSNSVRGYGEGEVGSGRSFLQATAEYRFPMFSFVGGALFADFGTDLGSGENVPGDPAGIREKPGSGYGIGLGVRVQSPLGPIRADYTVLSDDGDSRFQFGIGQRF